MCDFWQPLARLNRDQTVCSALNGQRSTHGVDPTEGKGGRC